MTSFDILAVGLRDVASSYLIVWTVHLTWSGVDGSLKEKPETVNWSEIVLAVLAVLIINSRRWSEGTAATVIGRCLVCFATHQELFWCHAASWIARYRFLRKTVEQRSPTRWTSGRSLAGPSATVARSWESPADTSEKIEKSCCWLEEGEVGCSHTSGYCNVSRFISQNTQHIESKSRKHSARLSFFVLITGGWNNPLIAEPFLLKVVGIGCGWSATAYDSKNFFSFLGIRPQVRCIKFWSLNRYINVALGSWSHWKRDQLEKQSPKMQSQPIFLSITEPTVAWLTIIFVLRKVPGFIPRVLNCLGRTLTGDPPTNIPLLCYESADDFMPIIQNRFRPFPCIN